MSAGPTQIETSNSVSRDDVVWCYCNLLGREPESEAAVEFHSHSKSFRELIETFAKSAEFRALMRTAKAAQRNRPASPIDSPDFMRILREEHQVRSIEIAPTNDSPLFIRDDEGVPIRVCLRSDDVIGLSTLRTRHWDISKPRFLQRIAGSSNEEFLLIDVGANVGLFARQCLAVTPKVGALYAYEPHPENFTLLCRNLSGIRRARTHNFGLAEATSTRKLFLDPNNAGNYSLNVNAMPSSFTTTSIEVVQAREEQAKWLAHELPIFYKSDTQGFDEVIATSLSEDFWQFVLGGIFELWRIPGKSYDADAFARILDQFPNKVFDKKPNTNVSTPEVIGYLQSADHEFDDLLFWRS